MNKKLTRQDCISLLQQKYRELSQERYPKRSDFSEREVMAVKAHLGPWPRALEAAGIKPVRDGDRAEKVRQKRIQAKRTRTAAKLAKKAEQLDGVPNADVKIQQKKENTP